jgi:periplasmic divalent cation tolerance protein
VSSEAILVLTTCGSAEEAAKIAEMLVEQRFAACVSLVEGIMSTYRWDSKLQKDEEVLLLIKTTQDRYETVEKTILQRTSYELPDILAVPVNTGFPDYLNWLAASVRPEK